MALLDRWWEAVLGESSEDDGGVSFDTSSAVSLQSSQKPSKWLLPRHSASQEESLGEDSDVFDFSNITGRTSESKTQTKPTSTRKSKWGFLKKASEKGNQKGRKTKKKQKEQRDDTDQQKGWFDFFDSSTIGTMEEEQRESDKKEENFSWAADFVIFADDRDDDPSYDESEQRHPGSYDWGFFLNDPSTEEDDFTETSSSIGGLVDVWENTSGLLGSPSDATVSTQESSSDNTDEEAITSLLKISKHGASSPVPRNSTAKTEAHSKDHARIDKKQNSSPDNAMSNTEPITSLGSTVDSSSFSRSVNKQSRKESRKTSLRSSKSGSFLKTKAKPELQDQPNKQGANQDDSIDKGSDEGSLRCAFPMLKKNERADKLRDCSSKVACDQTNETSASRREQPETDKTNRNTNSVPTQASSGVHQKALETQDKVPLKKSRLLGLVMCQSVKHGEYDEYIDASLPDGSIADSGQPRFKRGEQHDTEISSDKYAVVRMVPDSERTTRHGTSDGLLELSNLELARGRFPEHMVTNLITEDNSVTRDGPVSMYVYDCDYKTHMGLVYDDFNEEVRVRKYSSPPRARPGEILIKVEASTVSQNDCTIRKGGWWRDEKVPLPNTPGVDLVGVVHEVSKRVASNYFLNTGDRVLAFVKWGGNARYAAVPGDRVVPIRVDVDPAEAVCLAETYLSAFQSLQIGQSAGVRYGSESLCKKSILVLGARSSMGRAVVELAFTAGVSHVYAAEKVKHHKALRSLGAIPLDRNPKMWLHDLQGEIDLVLIAESDEIDPSILKVLSREGSVVFIGKNVSAAHSALLQEGNVGLMACTKDKASLMKRTHAYDVFESWERNTARCKHDMLHLLQLLAAKQVKPHIVDRIPLERVGRAQQILDESKGFPEIFVCEPWVKAKRRALYL